VQIYLHKTKYFTEFREIRFQNQLYGEISRNYYLISFDFVFGKITKNYFVTTLFVRLLDIVNTRPRSSPVFWEHSGRHEVDTPYTKRNVLIDICAMSIEYYVW